MPISALETSQLETLSEWPDYHSSLPEYANRFPGQLGHWILKKQTDALLQEMALPEDFIQEGVLQALTKTTTSYDVLDVGGGHGQVTPMLLELEKRVATVVSDPRATDTLQKLLAPLPPGCTSNYTLITSPLNNLPFESRSIPLVISLRMVCHMSDWRDYVKELCRVASSQVIIDYPSLRSINCLHKQLFKAKLIVEGNTRGFTVFSDMEIATEFKRHGFSKIRLHRQFTLPLALHRAIKRPWISEKVENTLSKVGITSLVGSPVILSATR